MEITLLGKQFFINKVLFFCLIIFLIISSGVLGYFLQQIYKPLSASDSEKSDTQIIQPKAELSDEISKPEEVPEIKVYVIGCVNKPGVVTLKKGQVIDDAIKIAGGATKEADIENINLAYKLNENTMLRIKSKVNKTQQQSKAPIKAASGKVAIESVMNSGVHIVTDSLGTVVEEPEDKDSGAKKSSLININKASQAELENLPNVGPATAKAIIAYREKNDGFKKITDIMKITGIKQKTYDKIKECICIE